SQIGKAETPVRTRRRLDGDVGVEVPRGDARAWHDRALRIEDASADTPRIDGFLCMRRHRAGRDRTREQNEAREKSLLQLASSMMGSPTAMSGRSAQQADAAGS